MEKFGWHAQAYFLSLTGFAAKISMMHLNRKEQYADKSQSWNKAPGED